MLSTTSLRIGSVVSLATFLLVTSSTHGFVDLVAEAYPTPGVPGFTTYDLYGLTDEGFFNGFDFVDINGAGRGITGPLRQAGGPFSTAVDDTGWLVNNDGNASILGVRESEEELRAVYVYRGFSPERDFYTEWLFGRIVTDSPDEVFLDGVLLVTPPGEPSFLTDFTLPLTDVRLVPEPTSALLAALAFGLVRTSRR